MTKTVATTKAPGAVATTGGAQLPDYLRGQAGGSGLQGLSADDFIVPRIKLLQGTSTEPETFDNAKPGMFWLNVLDLPLGQELTFTPILNRKRVMLMPPMGDGRGVFARANDGKTWNTLGEWEVRLKGMRTPVKWTISDLDVRRSGLMEFGSQNPENPDSPPAATLFYDFLVWVHDQEDLGIPVLLSLARTAAKKARDLQMKIEAMQAPMWSRKFLAKPIKDKNSEGQEFFNWQFQAAGFVSEDTFDMTSNQRRRFMEMNFRGADDDQDDTAAAEASAKDREY